jgi:hypothetical protein
MPSQKPVIKLQSPRKKSVIINRQKFSTALFGVLLAGLSVGAVWVVSGSRAAGDLCSNLSGVQQSVPDGYELTEAGCLEVQADG